MTTMNNELVNLLPGLLQGVLCIMTYIYIYILFAQNSNHAFIIMNLLQ